MPLKYLHDTLDEIPEVHRELYTEKNGKYELTGIEGIKTQADIDRLSGALTKERNDHKAVKDLLNPWTSLGKKPEEIKTILDELPALQAAAKNQLDQSKIDELLGQRLKIATGPLERQVQELSGKLAEKDKLIEEFQGLEVRRTIFDAVRREATGTKMLDTAIDDALLYADREFEVVDGAVVQKETGNAISVWLTEMKTKRPHWWPASEGGGAGGGKGNQFVDNPWSADKWNKTRQAQVYTQKGEAVASQMAKAAGTTLHGPRPAAKK